MQVKDMLKIESLKDAKLVAGNSGIYNVINGVNVLEALDIENWGRSGEVILTSFFALRDLKDSELDNFFKKLSEIDISAIIIKIERLLQQIPIKIIELCDEHSIPLIQIGKTVKYESIILEILGPIINRNVYLLNKYYEIHSELTSLALKMPSIDEILSELKKMILRDVSLINTAKAMAISTNPELSEVTIINSFEITKEKYMQFSYIRSQVIYNRLDSNIAYTQISVRVPYIGFNDYELIIHEMTDQINAEDFMIIENAVKFLQMELLKKYVISQNIFQQKNNIIGDLLNNRLYERKDIDEVLDSLDINKYKHYEVILVKLYQREESKKLDKNLMFPILSQIRSKFKQSIKNLVYMEKSDRVVFIHNFQNEDGINKNYIEKIMNSLGDKDLFKEFCYRISISSQIDKFSIPRANIEVLDTQKVLRLFHNSNKILPYEELGIYKLFLESNNLDELVKFLSPKMHKFIKDYPQLFETLRTYLDTNQSYTLTSEKQFLHPKTVRYRIDKVKEILGTEFTDPEEILQIQVTSRLLKLMEQEENR